MKSFLKFVLTVAVAVAFSQLPSLAQSGNVLFFGAVSGTTLAANCPTAPATPSVCIVGDGAWVWQSSTTGWQQIGAGGTSGAVTSVTINGVAKPGPSPSFTISATNSIPTISAPTATAPVATVKAQ